MNRMMKKKFLVFSVLIAMVFSSLTGCSCGKKNKRSSEVKTSSESTPETPNENSTPQGFENGDAAPTPKGFEEKEGNKKQRKEEDSEIDGGVKNKNNTNKSSAKYKSSKNIVFNDDMKSKIQEELDKKGSAISSASKSKKNSKPAQVSPQDMAKMNELFSQLKKANSKDNAAPPAPAQQSSAASAPASQVQQSQSSAAAVSSAAPQAKQSSQAAPAANSAPQPN